MPVGILMFGRSFSELTASRNKPLVHLSSNKFHKRYFPFCIPSLERSSVWRKGIEFYMEDTMYHLLISNLSGEKRNAIGIARLAEPSLASASLAIPTSFCSS